MPIRDWAMANQLRAASALNFGTFRLALGKPNA
jgi:hypothetical protein